MKTTLCAALVAMLLTAACSKQTTNTPRQSSTKPGVHAKWLALAGKNNWKAYPQNPIITPGPKGTWDSWAVMSMTVVKVGDTFHLYYEGGLTGCRDLQIGHASSSDGLNWVKDPENPVLRPGKAGEWDEGATWDPFVIYEDGLFKMWYGGERKGVKQGWDYQCGYAVSKDGTHFRKAGKITTFARGNIGDMHVYHDRDTGRYYMYYWDRAMPKADRLRVAVSPNETGFDFENAQTIRIENETPGHRYTQVIKQAKTWYMFYGYENKGKTGLAISSDGLDWKAVKKYLLPSEDAEILPIDDDIIFMFYCPKGFQDEKDCDIRLAIFNGRIDNLAQKE